MDQTAYPDLPEETRKRLSGLSSLSGWIVGLSWACIVFIVIGIVLLGHILSIMAQIVTETASQQAIDNLEKAGNISSGLFAVISTNFIICAFLLLIWVYKTHKLLQDHGETMENSPGWSVGWWFVPVLNLYKPYTIIRNLQSVVRIKPTDETRLPNIHVGLWWILLVSALVFDKYGTRLIEKSQDIHGTIAGLIIYLISCSLLIIASLLFIRILRTIQKDIPERIGRGQIADKFCLEGDPEALKTARFQTKYDGQPVSSTLSKWVRGSIGLFACIKIAECIAFSVFFYIAHQASINPEFEFVKSDLNEIQYELNEWNSIIYKISIFIFLFFVYWTNKMHSRLKDIDIKTILPPLANVILLITPILNIISSPVAIAALVQAVRPKEKPGFLLTVPFIAIWWLVVIVAIVAVDIGERLLTLPGEAAVLRNGAGAMAVSALAYCIAAILLIALVGCIQKSLNDRIRRVQETGRPDPDSEIARRLEKASAGLPASS